MWRDIWPAEGKAASRIGMVVKSGMELDKKLAPWSLPHTLIQFNGSLSRICRYRHCDASDANQGSQVAEEPIRYSCDAVHYTMKICAKRHDHYNKGR
ncbi:hypothetical protein RRF57_008972 [Xylaria bambusicola]|uniref:Uncharacterized protein n=1 Tax=Xylaria bambusicola TaxID=326684 RepID=A0AAN7UU72_9PEZI